MSSQDILYVEDEEDYQLLVVKILERAGFHVRVADTGAAGLAALEEKCPDLLILDINLPDALGYDICQKLRDQKQFQDLPILMLTVRRRPEEWLRGFSHGATDYIAKPINPPELLERVMSCLADSASNTPREGTPEYQLIQAVVSGNRSAFQVLIEQYRHRLIQNMRSFTRSDEETDEIVSRAFLVAYEKMDQFRGESSFYTWLYRIAMFEITRQRRGEHTVSLEVTEDMSEEDPGLDRWADQELAAQAQDALGDVPNPYRKLLQLYFLRDQSYEDISRKLKMPMGTVMSRLHKARHLLRESWDKKHKVYSPG